MPATICVYALVPAAGAERVPGTGIAGERLRLVRAGAVAAVVGAQARQRKPTESNLRDYDRVMQALMQRFSAVVPARFGTYFADDAEMDLVLRARQKPLKEALARVRNRVQMNVRVLDVGRALSGPPGEPDKVRPAGESGTAYLQARAYEQRAVELDGVRPAIKRWIGEERVERRASIASVYHLVPRRSASAYRAALERAAAEQGVRLMVSGPWAPYAFAAW